jgi:cytochrome c biogenesis protein CcmG/thiol:disulfide interchange protein DsbE
VRRRLVLPSLVMLAAGALIALLVFGVAGQQSDTSIDAAVLRGSRPAAPGTEKSLAWVNTQGSTRLSDLRGKVVVVNVFASWCAPCKAEAPVLEQTQREIAGSNATVLGVGYLDDSGDLASFAREQHMTYPIVHDVSGEFVRSFGTTGVPETFVIDRRGRVAAVRRFQVDSKWLQKTLPRILAERS